MICLCLENFDNLIRYSTDKEMIEPACKIGLAQGFLSTYLGAFSVAPISNSVEEINIFWFHFGGHS